MIFEQAAGVGEAFGGDFCPLKFGRVISSISIPYITVYTV